MTYTLQSHPVRRVQRLNTRTLVISGRSRDSPSSRDTQSQRNEETARGRQITMPSISWSKSLQLSGDNWMQGSGSVVVLRAVDAGWREIALQWLPSDSSWWLHLADLSINNRETILNTLYIVPCVIIANITISIHIYLFKKVKDEHL